MKVLVIGSGGREHAIVLKLKQSPQVKKVICAPGNCGISRDADCIPLEVGHFAGLANFVTEQKIDLTIVGPEVPLAAGIVDYFKERSLSIFGPDRKAARLESSKSFAKGFMEKYGIPTARHRSFTDMKAAMDFLHDLPLASKVVVKADGLAAGKGVIICENSGAAREAVSGIMNDRLFGEAGKEVIIEEFLSGEEVSIQVFMSGSSYKLMAAAQDHKRVFDGDQGPNTGGMGAYAPAPIADDALLAKVRETVMKPLVKGLSAEGIDYKGVLYLGLMVVDGEPFVLEFNCRFGDPETQVVLPLLRTDLVEIINKINSGELVKLEIDWYNGSAVCVVLASGGYPGDYEKGKAINGINEASAVGNVVVFSAGTTPGPCGKCVTSGGRVLGVTGIAKDIASAIATAYRAVSKISFEGMHYRKDIGKKALLRMGKQ